MDPFFHTGLSISDSLKTVRKSVLIYETIIVTSNFQSFYIYDMEKPGGDPEIIQLEDLEKEYYRLHNALGGI